MDAIASRLKQAREAAGFDSAQAACAAFGFTYSTYAGHENGSRGIPRDTLIRYAKAFKTTASWLIEGRGTAQSPASELEIGGQSFLPVPVYDIRAAAGAGALIEDGAPASQQIFQKDFLRRVSRAPPEKLAVIQVSGDSMWETLHDGDAVLVDRTVRRVVKDGIYILLFEDELLVKRCQRDLSDGSLIVKSDNPRYDAFRVTEADRLNVIGRVIWIGRALG